MPCYMIDLHAGGRARSQRLPLESSFDLQTPRELPAALLRIYVAALPASYQKPWSAEELYGFHSLGRIANITHNVWNTLFHMYDKWWINQAHISPLRVSDVAEADVVFVPATLRHAWLGPPYLVLTI